jgi:hypothetical protein
MTNATASFPTSARDRLPWWGAQPWELGARPWDVATTREEPEAEESSHASVGRSPLTARTPTAHTLLDPRPQRAGRPRLPSATLATHHRAAGSRRAG